MVSDVTSSRMSLEKGGALTLGQLNAEGDAPVATEGEQVLLDFTLVSRIRNLY